MTPATLDELDALVQEQVGARLFTVLAWSSADRVLTRVHSNRPLEYPVGGQKTLEVSGGWLSRCVDEARPWLGPDAAAVREVFADHALIESLGCGAVANAPVLRDGLVVGILNALDAEGAYDLESLHRLADIAARSGHLLPHPGGPR